VGSLRDDVNRKLQKADCEILKSALALCKEVPMTYTNVALKDKIMEMYPEIRKHNVSVGLYFDERENVYLITFRRGAEELTTHLEKKDADDCMNGTKCVYLGMQVGQFIKNFEERVTFGRKVA
jgi:hypothetical protein